MVIYQNVYQNSPLNLKVPSLEEFAPLLEEQARQFQLQWHLYVS